MVCGFGFWMRFRLYYLNIVAGGAGLFPCPLFYAEIAGQAHNDVKRALVQFSAPLPVL